MPLLLKGGGRLVLYEDSRNQVGEHKNIWQYCDRHGIEIVRQKLEVGDYMLDPINGKISVDTKASLLEIAKNICSSDHRRFKSECERSLKMGIQLIVLIEEFPPFGEVDLWEVPRWRRGNQYHRLGDPITLIEPRTLKKAMQTMTDKYGVKFRFCTRRQSPQRVIKYLKGEFK